MLGAAPLLGCHGGLLIGKAPAFRQQWPQNAALRRWAACRLPPAAELGTSLQPVAAAQQLEQQRWRRLRQQCGSLRLRTAAAPLVQGLSSPLPARPLFQPLAPTPRPRSSRLASANYDALVPLGLDFLTFLAATVLVIPVFKSAKQSPVLGFLFAGVVMGQLGLFRNVEEIEKLSELGVLFLLFEMGLELTIDKLRALAKYAFGLGFLQILVCTAAFTAMALPAGKGIMTQFMEIVLHAPSSLAAIRSVDEAVVIAVALSLSSSAFVLQLLKERGELSGKFGQATLGILLAQDIATVPFLVLLPLVEGGGGKALAEGGPAAASLLAQLGPTAAKTLGGLAGLLVGGRVFLRRIFELVAGSRSEETFIALCLLSVTGASLLTQRMGFSDTLGAFGAGVLLAETNFKTQVEADIQPFRGILLGLFFVTTGATLDVSLLLREWPIVLTLLGGLLALKITAITAISPLFGLSKSDSIRTGFVLSQGGEFAFVLLALANRLEILPEELNKLLIIVVVLSMALTPVLTEVGKQAGKWVTARDGEGIRHDEYWAEERVTDPVVICGFGDVGQMVANMLESPVMSQRVPYVVFDLSPARVEAAQEAGFPVLYGEGSRKKVLHAAGIETPRAVAIGYTARQRAVTAVEKLRESYPDVPIYVRAVDLKHAAELEAAGATVVVTAETEAGLGIGTRLAQAMGVAPTTTSTLEGLLRQDMDARTARMAMVLEREGEAGSDDGSAAALQSPVYKVDHSSMDYEAAISSAAATAAASAASAVDAAGGPGSSAAASGSGPESGEPSGVGAAVAKLGAGVANFSATFLQTIDLSSPQDEDTGILPGSSSGSGSGAERQLRAGETATRQALLSSQSMDGSVVCPVGWEGTQSSDDEESSSGGAVAVAQQQKELPASTAASVASGEGSVLAGDIKESK